MSLWNGSVQIISTRTGRVSYVVDFGADDLVVTSSKFFPQNESSILITAADGSFGVCNYKTGEFAFKSKEEDNSLNCCDISHYDSTYAIAGQDRQIRIYDSNTNQVKLQPKKEELTTSHTGRIFSLVYSKTDPNAFFSGSWDCTVVMWDTRTGTPSMIFGGPNISGDTVDVKDNLLLTGAWRKDKALELWDIRRPDAIKQGDWGKEDMCMIYSAKFCPTDDFILAGGAESRAMKLFDNTLVSFARHGVFKGDILSVGISGDGNIIMAADSKGKVQAFSRI